MITLPIISTSGQPGQPKGASTAASTDESTSVGSGQESLFNGKAGPNSFSALLGDRVALLSQSPITDAVEGRPAAVDSADLQSLTAGDKNPFTKTRIATLLTQETHPGTEADAALPLLSSTATRLPTITAASDDEKTLPQSDQPDADIQALFAMLPADVQTITRTAIKKTATDSNDELKKNISSAGNAASLVSGLQNEKNALRNNSNLAQTEHTQQPNNATQSVENRDLLTQAAVIAQGQITQPVRSEADSRSASSSTSSSSATPVLSSHSLSSLMAPAVNDAASSTSTSTAQINAPLGSQEWQQSLNQHITLFTRQGQQSAEIRLHPEDLGTIQISLKLDNDHAQLSLLANHAQVRSALESAIPQLRSALADSGITLGQSQVGSENLAQNPGFANQQQSQTARDNSQSTPTVTSSSEENNGTVTLATPATLQAKLNGNSSVDIFA